MFPLRQVVLLRHLRRHSLVYAAVLLGCCMLVFFSWAEWNYFQDQARALHQEPGGFWSAEHFHDWAYNAASNWQSEFLFGIAVVAILHRLPGGEADQT